MKRLKEGAATFIRTAADWTPDAMMLGGAAMLSYGASLIYFPAGFVVGGVALLAFGYLTRSGN